LKAPGAEMKIIAAGNSTLGAFDRCLTRTPNTKLEMIWNICWMVCKSRLLYGVETRKLDECENIGLGRRGNSVRKQLKASVEEKAGEGIYCVLSQNTGLW